MTTARAGLAPARRVAAHAGAAVPDEQQATAPAAVSSARVTLEVSPARVLQGMLLAVAALTAAHLVAQVRNGFVGNADRSWLNTLVYLNNEETFASWYSSMALLGVAALLGAVAQRARRSEGSYPLHWAALAAIFVAMSLDESARLHEMADTRLKSALDTGGLLYFAWVLPALAVVAAVVVSYLGLLRSLPPRTRALFVLAGVVYVLGAAGGEMLQGPIVEERGTENAPFVILSTVEEVFEMVGVAILVYALLDYLGALRRHDAAPRAATEARAAGVPR